MKTIVTHPDNVNWLQAKLEAEERKSNPDSFHGFFSPLLFSFTIKPNPNIERDKATGRYKLFDGRTVAKADICIRTKFITYGPEDIDWLLSMGLITEERERLFYEVDERFTMRFFDFTPKYSAPRSFLFCDC